MSTVARILPRISVARRSYSSFGGGRYFNSSKPPKSPVVTAKSKSETSGPTSNNSSTAKTPQTNNTSSKTSNPLKSAASDATSSAEHGHESNSDRQAFRNGSAVSIPSPSPDSSSPSSTTTTTTPSTHLSGYRAQNAYHNFLSAHPSVNSKDFKIHQFFSLHRPLLLISNPASIFTTPPVDEPLLRSSMFSLDGDKDGPKSGEDKLPPSPFTSLNLDGTYDAVAGIDGDAEAARQLHHSMTMSRIGAVADWEETLMTLGIDVSKDIERVKLREQWNREWEEVRMDSVKRKRKKKMKKHKLKKRRRATRAQRIKIGR